jgi:hypothetical protein
MLKKCIASQHLIDKLVGQENLDLALSLDNLIFDITSFRRMLDNTRLIEPEMSRPILKINDELLIDKLDIFDMNKNGIFINFY